MIRFLKCCLLVSVAALAAAAAADTIVIGPAGPYTIQQAIDLAQPGDVVELLDGTYTGDGNRDLELRGKAITVRSQGGDPNACVIDCEGTPQQHHRAFVVGEYEGRDTVVEGLTITGAYANSGAGMHCWGGYPTVRHCRFVGNFSVGDGGGLNAGGPVLVQDCWFIDNEAIGGGGAAATMAYGDPAVFERCTFVGNIAAGYGGGHRT